MTAVALEVTVTVLNGASWQETWRIDQRPSRYIDEPIFWVDYPDDSGGYIAGAGLQEVWDALSSGKVWNGPVGDCTGIDRVYPETMEIAGTGWVRIDVSDEEGADQGLEPGDAHYHTR